MEDSDCFSRAMWGNNREFTMNLFGPENNLLVKMHRPFTCQCNCYGSSLSVGFCLNTPEIHILDANEQSCGCVKNIFNCCDHNFSITDQNGLECMSIRGSCCQPGEFCFLPMSPCNEIVYDVTNHRTGTTGTIKRKWDTWARSLVREMDPHDV